MNDRDLMQLALSLEEPWTVSSVEFNKPEGRLDLTVAFPKGARFPCPECGTVDQGVYDTQERTWRHLDFFQHQAYLHAKVPRVDCTKCGVKTVSVPWARPKSGFTLLFRAGRPLGPWPDRACKFGGPDGPRAPDCPRFLFATFFLVFRRVLNLPEGIQRPWSHPDQTSSRLS